MNVGHLGHATRYCLCGRGVRSMCAKFRRRLHENLHPPEFSVVHTVCRRMRYRKIFVVVP